MKKIMQALVVAISNTAISGSVDYGINEEVRVGPVWYGQLFYRELRIR